MNKSKKYYNMEKQKGWILKKSSQNQKSQDWTGDPTRHKKTLYMLCDTIGRDNIMKSEIITLSQIISNYL